MIVAWYPLRSHKNQKKESEEAAEVSSDAKVVELVDDYFEED